GYTVMDTPHPQVILVGNGSEVSLLCEVAALLEAGEVPARVVSVPSIGLFERQSEEYRQSVIPRGVPVFGLTAGLSSTLLSVCGPNAKIYGLDRFGASAPYKVLDEKFGFTAQNILDQVLKFIGRE
ncbi:MAG: transketolase, partial [Muribaculaceae bacterium]|nr:transketolase [Muribaculaceae bacterium]